MICTPAYGAMVALPYFQSMITFLSAMQRHGIYPLVHTTGNESLVTRARNGCVNEFLKSPATHLVFIDADIGFRPQDLVDLLSSGLDVVFGAYPKKEVAFDKVFDAIKSGQVKTWQEAAERQASWAINFQEQHAETGAFPALERGGKLYIEVKEASTGFCCISRSAIQKMLDAFGEEISYSSDTNGKIGDKCYSLFDCASVPEGHSDVPLLTMRQAARAMVKSPSNENVEALVQAATSWVDSAGETGKCRYMSEDYLFSRRWQSLGGKVYVSMETQLTHSGFYTFSGNFPKMFKKQPGTFQPSDKKLKLAP
jgi:hypothetical protein